MERETQADDSRDYWQDGTDPDGVHRERTSEAEYAQYVSDIADELKFWRGLPGGVLLDYGCGVGWFLRAVGDGWVRYGLDASEIARREAGRYGVITDSLPLYPSYDAIRCHHVIEHLDHPYAAVCGMYSALRRGGRFVVSTPDFGSPCAERFGEAYRMLHDKTHTRLFTLESLMRMVRDINFTVERVSYPFPMRYATSDTMAKWRSGIGVWSPPWPGNWVTLYCRKP